jgi:hypothetical protein
MRIDSSGIVGMGTTNLGDTSRLKLASAVTTNRATSAQLTVARTTASTQYEGICFNTGVDRAAYILRVPNNDALTFGFDTGGGTSEAMRINTSNNVLIGTTSPSQNARFESYKTGNITCVLATQGDAGDYCFATRAFNNGGTYYHFNFQEGGTQRGSITSNGSNTTYSTGSDYRLKDNIAPMTGGLDKISALNPVTWKWKSNGSDGQGFLAHELAEVCPDAVTGAKDSVDENGNPVYQMVDVSYLIATLTAAIQELKAEFDAYKATHP